MPMTHATSTATRTNFVWRDFLASIVVFLTALPLCMGIALASGAPIEAGLLTGIVGGLVIGCISGCELQISGPAAGLSVLVFEIVQRHGFGALAGVIIVAGIIQICAGALRWGQLFRAVSPAVVNGMMSGIGVLIIVSQIYIMAGGKPHGSGLDNIRNLPSVFAAVAAGTAADPHTAAALIGLATIALIVAWKCLAPKAAQVLPGALVAIIGASLAAAALKLPVQFVSLPGSIFDSINLAGKATFGFLPPDDLFRYAVALALIASAETLLSASAVDRMHMGRRTRYDRELLAQGLGNTICGLLGALPMTGVIARSSVNVHAGARTRLSAVLHGAWLLVFVAALPFVLKQIPLSCLSALLVYTGVKLIDPNSIKRLWQYGPRLVGIYLATVVAIVTTDLLVGVTVGVCLSVIKLIYTMARLKVTVEHDVVAGQLSLRLRGAATFISLPKLAEALDRVPANTELHACLDELDYVDHACLELLMDWERQHKAAGGSLVIDWGELKAVFRDKRRSREKQFRHLRPLSTPSFLSDEMPGARLLLPIQGHGHELAHEG
jgi:MFS superfamily sulfate permease-like transporter